MLSEGTSTSMPSRFAVFSRLIYHCRLSHPHPPRPAPAALIRIVLHFEQIYVNKTFTLKYAEQRLTAETAGGGRSGGGDGAADASTAKGDKKGDGGSRSRRKHHSRERKSSKAAGRKDASSRSHGSGKRSASSPSRKKHATPQGGGGGGGGVAEIDLMGFGSPPPGMPESAQISPSLLLQTASSPVGAPAAPAAGTAMRAPPPSSLQGTWESDLSAILSAAAPPVQQDAAPVARSGGGSSGLLSDLEGMGVAGAGVEAGAGGHERRKGGE